MALAFKCDRCSKFFEKKDLTTKETLIFGDAKVSLNGLEVVVRDQVTVAKADLCPECCRCLSAFIANKEVKPNV